jgi:3-deoxy-manno-octulosonate cytidylyltransferase (CMP-KDO synthetase)
MEALIIIPARMASTRFPGKPLAKICGKEMILHVCERCEEIFPTVVATPDEEIHNVVLEHLFVTAMTGDHMTGTDRIAEAAEYFDADIYINVQGDEPLINIDDIKNIYNAKKVAYNCVIGSMKNILPYGNGENVVKVTTKDGQLVNMTRKGNGLFGQCGLYAFNKNELRAFAEYKNKKQSLEEHENIELMRFVDMGYNVKMITINGGIAVDMPRDIQKVEEEIEHGRQS